MFWMLISIFLNYLRLAESYVSLFIVRKSHEGERGADRLIVVWSSHRSGLQQQQLIKVLLTAVAVKNDLWRLSDKSSVTITSSYILKWLLYWWQNVVVTYINLIFHQWQTNIDAGVSLLGVFAVLPALMWINTVPFISSLYCAFAWHGQGNNY